MISYITIEKLLFTRISGPEHDRSITLLREYVTDLVMRLSTGKEAGFRFFFLPILIDC
jgi:hypothetical protein